MIALIPCRMTRLGVIKAKLTCDGPLSVRRQASIAPAVKIGKGRQITDAMIFETRLMALIP